MSSPPLSDHDRTPSPHFNVTADHVRMPLVSNLLRRFALHSSQGPPPSSPLHLHPPSRLGASPLGLAERHLAHDIGVSSASAGSGSLSTGESHGSSDPSEHVDCADLQSFWELATGATTTTPQLHHLGATTTTNQLHHQGSPLNPALPMDGNPPLRQQAELSQQEQLRQQLGMMATAMLLRSTTTVPLPPSGSIDPGRASPFPQTPTSIPNSGRQEPNTPPKRSWADHLTTSSSLPPISPASSSPPPSASAGESLSSLLLGALSSGTNAETSVVRSKGKEEDKKEIKEEETEGSGSQGTDSGAGKGEDWEPRVRRKKAKTNSGSDDDGTASDDGVVRIKAKSMTEWQRRDRINDALRRLRGVVNSHGDMATMLCDAVDLIQKQKRRIDELEMQILQQRLREQLSGGLR